MIKGDIVGMVVFGICGMGALIGAVFCKATHQFATVGICAIMVIALYAEYKKEKENQK